MSRTRHVPLRRCVACRASLPKRDLIRIVRQDGGWALDLRQRAPGRGTSLCPRCALAALRRDDAARWKGFGRAFRNDTTAVLALLADLEPTLAAATGPGASVEPLTDPPVRQGTARHRPNGGMHG